MRPGSLFLSGAMLFLVVNRDFFLDRDKIRLDLRKLFFQILVFFS